MAVADDLDRAARSRRGRWCVRVWFRRLGPHAVARWWAFGPGCLSWRG